MAIHGSQLTAWMDPGNSGYQVWLNDWFLPESAEMGDIDPWIWSNDFHEVDSDLSHHSLASLD